MIDSSSKARVNHWNPNKLDLFLAQVQALVELHEMQQKELAETKSVLREAQKELSEAQYKIDSRITSTIEETESTVTANENSAQLFNASEQISAQLNPELERIESTHGRGSKTIYSPQPPQPKDLNAFDRESVQKLLEDINSCIALLEE
jgi:hypothetical protein